MSSTEAEQDFNEYVDKHNIHGILKETIVKLCICRPDDPTKFFSDYFSGGDLGEPIHKFSEKELKDLRTCFEDADADGSGSIDKREMKKMLKKLGCYTTDKEFDCLFREIDADGSGEIEFDEFLAGVRKLLSPPTDEELSQKFKRLDQGGKGYLNFRDIKAGFQAMNHPISDRAINDMIAVASTDGDDQVTFEEFLAISKRPKKI